MFQLMPKTGAQKFGYIFSQPDDLPKEQPVNVCAVWCGLGEIGSGSAADLDRIQKIGIFGLGGKVANPTLYTSMSYWPIVYIFVQTTEASKYRSGEVAFCLEKIKEHWPNCVGKPNFISISLGGWVTEVLNTKDQCANWSRALLMVTGNTGPAANGFPLAAAAAGLEVYFYHALNDTTAPPALSMRQWSEFSAAGGNGYYVMYNFGAHGISSWPITAFYPGKSIGAWPMWNAGGQSVSAFSDKPNQSIYELMTTAQALPGPAPAVVKAARVSYIPAPLNKVIVYWKDGDQTEYAAPLVIEEINCAYDAWGLRLNFSTPKNTHVTFGPDKPVKN